MDKEWINMTGQTNTQRQNKLRDKLYGEGGRRVTMNLKPSTNAALNYTLSKLPDGTTATDAVSLSVEHYAGVLRSVA
jgi:hypothetical protein